MIPNLPLYRLTLSAPRNESPAETAVLAPIAGAAHSDPFVVASLQGITGAQPYLEEPKGRQGGFDPITRRLSAGNLSVDVFDPRTTPGGGNASRWVTAFIGDAQGRLRMKGCRAVLERSLDGTAASLTPYFTGRVRNVSLSGTQRMTLELEDGVDELSRRCFLGLPDPSITYAGMSALVPIGPPVPFENNPVTPRLTGTLVFDNAAGGISTGHIDFDATQDPLLGVITKYCHEFNVNIPRRVVSTAGFIGTLNWSLANQQSNEVEIAGTLAKHRRYNRAYVTSLQPIAGAGTVTITGGAGATLFSLSQATAIANGSIVNVGGVAYTVSGFSGTVNCTLAGAPNQGPVAFTVPDPRYVAIPAGSTQIAFYVTVDQPSTADAPILINDVHPVQLMADILDGKFSLSPGYAGARPLGLRDATAAVGHPWYDLLQDASFGTCRFIIDRSWKANDFIEQQICLPSGLGYAIDAQGRVRPFDLRRKATRTPVAAFTDADLVADAALSWVDARDGAITAVEFHYFNDRWLTPADIGNLTDLYPDVPSTRLVSTEQILYRINDLSTLRDVGEKVVKIVAMGMRVGNAEVDPTTGEQRGLQLTKDIEVAIADFLAPFQSGALKFKGTYRVSSTGAVSVGQFVTADHTKLPNPASNLRGGPRLALVIGRSESQGQVTLELLDYGAVATAAVPSITGVAADATDLTAIDVTVTGNAAGDQVAVWACVTDTSVVVRPPDTADAWAQAGVITGSGMLRCAPFPAGSRVWFRARSQAIGVAVSAPSAWVYAPAPGYLDFSAFSASLTATPDATDGSRCVLAWTVSSPVATDVYVRLASASVDTLVASLLTGSTTYGLEQLLPGTNYVATVKHRDAAGAVLKTNTAAFTAGAAVVALAVPTNPSVFAGQQGGNNAVLDGSYGLAVEASVIPGSVEFREAVETAPSSGVFGAPVSVALVPAVLGGWTIVPRTAPNDAKRRRLSARSVRGSNVSAWTAGKDVLPWSVVRPNGSSVAREFKEFGPVGTADDTATIQAAIDWSSTAGNGAVGGAGDYIVDHLTIRSNCKIVCPGVSTTRFLPKAGSTAAGLLLLDTGIVSNVRLEGFALDATGGGNAGQHGIYFLAMPTFTGGAWQGGLWYSTLRNILVHGFTGEQIWLHASGLEVIHPFTGPHQFCTMRSVVAFTTSLIRRALRLTGQVGQWDFDAGCQFDGSSGGGPRILGTENILIERSVDPGTFANNADTAPYSLDFHGTTSQTNTRAVSIERALNVVFEGAHFEECLEGISVKTQATGVSVRDCYFGNVGHDFTSTPGTGTITITGGAGVGVLSASQAGLLYVGADVTIFGVPYKVAAFNGTFGVTLTGAPNMAASPFSRPVRTTPGWAVKADGGFETTVVVDGNSFNGGTDLHFVGANNGQVMIGRNKHRNDVIRTAGATAQALAAAAALVTYGWNVVYVNAGATVVQTITSELEPGKTLTLRANGGTFTLGNSGNIDLSPYSTSTLAVRSGGSITLTRQDLTGSPWFITAISEPSSARPAARYVTAAATIAPGDGTIYVDASAGSVLLTFAAYALFQPGERVSIRRVDDVYANTVEIRDAAGIGPDGVTTYLPRAACTVDLENNFSGWNTVGMARMSTREQLQFSPGTGGYLKGLNHNTGAANSYWNGQYELALSVDASTANVANTVVARDVNGDFAARDVTVRKVLGPKTIYPGAFCTLRDNASPLTLLPSWNPGDSTTVDIRVAVEAQSTNAPNTIMARDGGGGTHAAMFYGDCTGIHNGNSTTASALNVGNQAIGGAGSSPALHALITALNNVGCNFTDNTTP